MRQAILGAICAVILATLQVHPAASQPPSGGLGLTRAEWEAAHGAPTGADPGGAFLHYAGGYAVAFDGEGLEAASHHIEQAWGDARAVSAEEARAAARALLPADAAQTGTSSSRAGNPVTVFRSAWLAGRVAPIWWLGDEPGTHIAIYRTQLNGRITSIEVAIRTSDARTWNSLVGRD
jgi:hypothetical protein